MMKALSIRAPWWWFILHGGKDIENRTWTTHYRGPVLIHASKWWNHDEAFDDATRAADIAHGNGHALPEGLTLGQMREAGGHIVGRATIVDCVTSSASPWFFGPVGFVLRDPIAFATPIRFKGALQLFDVPEEIIHG
jgi:ASCH domain